MTSTIVRLPITCCPVLWRYITCRKCGLSCKKLNRVSFWATLALLILAQTAAAAGTDWPHFWPTTFNDSLKMGDSVKANAGAVAFLLTEPCVACGAQQTTCRPSQGSSQRSRTTQTSLSVSRGCFSQRTCKRVGSRCVQTSPLHFSTHHHAQSAMCSRTLRQATLALCTVWVADMLSWLGQAPCQGACL